MYNNVDVEESHSEPVDIIRFSPIRCHAPAVSFSVSEIVGLRVRQFRYETLRHIHILAKWGQGSRL